tara:strand:- start:54 stop:692 length:639 start_codon:yes stop_codon:yes gene_type:complete
MSEGKLDKKKAKIRTCKFSDIRHIFEEFHYKKGAMGGGISVCFAMFIDGVLVGGSVMGKPRHEKKYKKCIDIRRMACLDSAPCNSESWFLSQIIRWCASNTDYNYVLSYSDKTVGHSGTIYKAANFKNIGETTPTKYVECGEKKYHPRSLSIDRPYSYKLREAVENGEAIVKTGLPKIIWIYEISDKLKRKNKSVGNFDKSYPNGTLFDSLK